MRVQPSRNQVLVDGLLSTARRTGTQPSANKAPPAAADAIAAAARDFSSLGGARQAAPQAAPPPPASPTPATVRAAAEPNLPIADLSTVTSSVELREGLTAETVKLTLDIPHSWKGDLVVTLVSPSGKEHVVSNRQGGSADDVAGTFDVSAAFAGEEAQGSWTLRVEDRAKRDVGTLKAWGLEITGQPAKNPDADPLTHLELLASDAMAGRDSPSPGLDAAAKYIQGMLEKYGVEGPNPNDPQGPHYQTFDMFRWASEGVAAPDPHSHTDGEFGGELFLDGFYVDETLGAEDLDLLAQRYGEHHPGRDVPIRSVDDVLANAERTGSVQNVMGLVPGTGPNKDEVIVVMAHYDHTGVNRNGSINNGADDNASGSSVLLGAIPELMKAQQEGKLDRSILILWTAAEEKGLVGAKYFADHPIPGIALDDIEGIVNIDMVGRWDDERVSIIDIDKKGNQHYLGGLLEQANDEMDDPFDRVNRDINQYRDRQDGGIFTKKGEDVLFLFEGLSNPNGGGQLNPDYHKPTDTVDKIYQDNGGEKVRRVQELALNLLLQASNRTEIAPVRERPVASETPAALQWL